MRVKDHCGATYSGERDVSSRKYDIYIIFVDFLRDLRILVSTLPLTGKGPLLRTPGQETALLYSVRVQMAKLHRVGVLTTASFGLIARRIAHLLRIFIKIISGFRFTRSYSI